MISDLLNELYRHPLKAGGHIFAVFSVINTLATGVTYFIPTIKFEGQTNLWVAAILSLFIGLRRAWKPSRVEIPVANCDTIIEVLFGNLFEQKGFRAIAVNEFFDSKIGTAVSDRSLHGKFLSNCFGGHPEAFDKQVDEQLKLVPSTDVPAKVEGKNKSYPIGTTALITVTDDKYIAFALSKTEPKTCKADSDVTLMWDALHELWQRARIETGGHEINLPLVGSGLSGLDLPTRDLLNLIILSAITATKEKMVTKRIRIVLLKERADELDLRDVRKYWIK